MNTKVLVIFFVVLAVLLVLPIVMQIIRATSDSPSSPPPLAADGSKAPPKLNETNLIGTAWTVKTPEIPVAVTIALKAGGVAEAKVPAMFAAMARQQLGTDTISGNWSVQGAKLIANVNVKGNTHTVSCDIIGDKIYYQDREIKRAY